MEILSHGTLPQEITYVSVCFNCKTKYRYKQSEGVVRLDLRDGDYIKTECPLCHKENFKAML